MKKTILMACTLVALTASMAFAGAGGLNLGWGECAGTPTSLNRTFACNTNAGTVNSLWGSYMAPSCVNQCTANEVVIDIQSTGATLPNWWVMRTGGCRNGAMLLNTDFTAAPPTCVDYWQGGATGGISQDPPAGNRARIKAVFALPAGSPFIGPQAEGTEYYSLKVNINNTKTAGLGACAGCQTGVCIVLNSIKVNQPVGEPCGGKFISSPAARNFATWQGGIGADCYAATPAKNTTWGSVKALYR